MTIRSTRLLSIALLMLPSSLVAYGCGTSTDPNGALPEEVLDGSPDGKAFDASASDAGTTTEPTDAATDTSKPDATVPAACAANQRVAAHVCVACAAGSTRAAGDNPTGQDTQCQATLCAADQHVSSHACVACAAGATNVAGDDASGADTTCDGTLCPSNQHVASHACVACPAGTTRAAGDDASGADTTCEATLCAADERVSSNACVTCPAGTTNAAGDDASGADTTCDATLCPADEHVSSNACVACPAGTTNAAGDDASGADTICDPTLCAADHHVSEHACVPCGANSVNAAGDDASGSDTTCDLVETDICASVAENAPLTLQCYGGAIITEITFASYGLPEGTCGNYSTTSCHASSSVTAMTTACKGKTSCTVNATNQVFTDPCIGVNKRLDVQAHCGLCGNGVKDGSEVCDDGVLDGFTCDSTCSSAPIVARIREHCDGASVITDDIGATGCVNISTNGASWLSMVAGVHATVYDTANCTGKSKVITATETNFCGPTYDEGGSLNDTVRSIRVERNP